MRKYDNTINGFCGIIFHVIVVVWVEFGCNTIAKLVNTSGLILRNVEAAEMKAEIFLNRIISNRSARSHFHFKNSFLNLFHTSLVSVTGFDFRLKALDNIPPCSYRFLILCHRFIRGKKNSNASPLDLPIVNISLNFATCSTNFSYFKGTQSAGAHAH